MLKLAVMMTVQGVFLVTSQVFLKMGLMKIEFESLSLMRKALALLSNLQVLLALLSMGIATLIWLSVLRNYDFSIAYPLVSISYVLSTVAGALIFKEQIGIPTVTGIALIIAGVIVITLGNRGGVL